MKYSQTHSGMTIIEVMIALLIFAIAIVVVLNATTTSVQYGALSEAQDDLLRDSSRITQAISGDLYTAGWLIPSGSALPATAAGDRATRYYPYAVVYGATGTLGALSSYHNLSASVVDPAYYLHDYGLQELDKFLPGTVADRTVVPSVRADFLASYFAPSQSLVFTKAVVEGWKQGKDNFLLSAARNQTSILDFGPRTVVAGGISDTDWGLPNNHSNLKVLHGSPWQVDGVGNITYRPGSPTIPYGETIQAGRLNLDDLSLQMVWETIDTPIYDPLAAITDLDLLVREYVYMVVPSPSGVGRLIRAHLERNPAGRSAAVALQSPSGLMPGDIISALSAFPNIAADQVCLVVDSVLSDNVMRIVFETIRTVPDGSLSLNQVRVRVYLARQMLPDHDRLVSRVADFIVVMRSKNTALQVLDDKALVGSVAGGLTY